MKKLITRKTLSRIRDFISEDAGRAAKITSLSKQLNTAVNERSKAAEVTLGLLEAFAEDSLGILETYVTRQPDMSIINNGLKNIEDDIIKVQNRFAQFDNLKETLKSNNITITSDNGTKKKPATKKKLATKKKPATKKVNTIKSKLNGGPLKDLGYPDDFCESIKLSEKQQKILDVLLKHWPLFMTPKTMARKGIIAAPDHSSGRVNELRKKGIPIESATQARKIDSSISTKSRGYRLVHGW